MFILLKLSIINVFTSSQLSSPFLSPRYLQFLHIPQYTNTKTYYRYQTIDMFLYFHSYQSRSISQALNVGTQLILWLTVQFSEMDAHYSVYTTVTTKKSLFQCACQYSLQITEIIKNSSSAISVPIPFVTKDCVLTNHDHSSFNFFKQVFIIAPSLNPTIPIKS
jgi:hypothetical protein